MTIKKAIKILDWWIDQKEQGIQRLHREWEFSNDAHGIGKTLLEVDKTIISNLETIKKELIPKCKHPKNMQDVDPKGNRYCMNCNWDL